MVKVTGTQGTGTQAAQVLVSVQTMRGNLGQAATLAAVQAAVATYNAAQPKGTQPHVVQGFTALAANTKGMQWQLAMVATVARTKGATMVRLSVHNGNVAICGTQAAVNATLAAVPTTYANLVTLAAQAYTPALGNKVGYQNAWLCGYVAGMQVAAKVVTHLQYGLGYLYPFTAPANGAAYATGQAAGTQAAVVAPKAPAKVRAPKTTQAVASTPQVAPQGTTATATPQAASTGTAA